VKVAPFFEARRDQLVTRWLDWAEGMLQRFDPVLNGYFSNALIEDDADSGLDCEQAIY
jgi:hypothetical protein